jgi:hypothetical protein
MTDTQNDNEVTAAEVASAQPASRHVQEDTVYFYASAGIAEHEGYVPTWLSLVVVSLLIWGLYYLITYWNAPIVQ